MLLTPFLMMQRWWHACFMLSLDPPQTFKASHQFPVRAPLMLEAIVYSCTQIKIVYWVTTSPVKAEEGACLLC